MNQDTNPKPLYGPIRKKINRLAHEQGLKRENALRASLLAQVEHARNQGATFAQLIAMVQEIEVNSK